MLSKLAQKSELNLTIFLMNGGRLEKEVRGLGIPVKVFPESRWGSGKIFLELVREFKKSNIQTVHTHKYKDTILTAPAAKLCGIPHAVRTVHGLRGPFEGLQAFNVHRYCVESDIAVSPQIEAR